MNISLDVDGNAPPQKFTWSDEKWYKVLGPTNTNEVINAYFPLISLNLSKEQLDSLTMNVDSKLTFRNDQGHQQVFSLNRRQLVREALDPISDELIHISFDASSLNWDKIVTGQDREGKDLPTQIKVKIISDDKSMNALIKPFHQNGNWNIPAIQHWYILKDKPVSIEAIFKLRSGKEITWKDSTDIRNDEILIGNYGYEGGFQFAVQDSDYENALVSN